MPTRKELHPMVDCNLRQHNNHSETLPMVFNGMPAVLTQNSPVFEALVACFLPVSDTLMHKLSLPWVGDALGAHDTTRGFSSAVIISLHSLTRAQATGEADSRNPHVAMACRKRGVDPSGVSSHDTNAHLTPKACIPRKFCGSRRVHSAHQSRSPRPPLKLSNVVVCLSSVDFSTESAVRKKRCHEWIGIGDAATRCQSLSRAPSP